MNSVVQGTKPVRCQYGGCLLLSSRRDIRSQIRAKRQGLSRASRIRCAKRLTANLVTSPLFQRSQRIACFFPRDGEIDLSLLFPRLFSLGKRAYLPVLHGKKLWFLPFDGKTPLVCNKYGIPEPGASPHLRCAPWALDLVLTPLVAFDDMGNRLGMGGGYYDRTFAYLPQRRVFIRPKLVGVAYAFQQMTLPAQNHWDIPMDAIVTDEGWHWISGNKGAIDKTSTSLRA
uniref:5-formyltetrahydrofolate cyclo-ligase n=1 Tax=Candidatus Kentrum sp. MB TaxID=2138164 RepID=A0A451BAK5_9GAMM|nr:MAG: 5-formyltetrahydrofolate cyclo-ligase [Candidatus Kentron sp. MB]VFK75321.1 MAG: 5-formyltetrahydrofolate cyclo-ligase [Candidatus Kentron sp. MB]